MIIKIEIPKGSIIKEEEGIVNRILRIPMSANYGYIKDTLAPDGDAYDAVILNETFTAGQQIDTSKTKLVALIKFMDDEQVDDKALFVFNPGSKEGYVNNDYCAPYTTLYEIEKYVAYLRWYKLQDNKKCEVAKIVLDKSLEPYLRKAYPLELPYTLEFLTLEQLFN